MKTLFTFNEPYEIIGSSDYFTSSVLLDSGKGEVNFMFKYIRRSGNAGMLFISLCKLIGNIPACSSPEQN